VAHLMRKMADRGGAAFITSLKLAAIIKSRAYDNGREFAEHSATDRAPGSVAYFADHYSSWQRGSNNNLDDPALQFIPESRPLSTASDKDLAIFQDRRNNRPRKRRPPLEMLTLEFHHAALRN
jgi:transposase, IS30 family